VPEDSAQVVIVGGGAMGTSTAYHLAQLGVTDVVLCERETLGSGSTSKSAGGIRAQFADEINIRIALISLLEFRNFEERIGTGIDFRETGYLFLLDSDRLTHWEEGVRILEPHYPWELVQIGNCGPPIELDEGWLLLTHGVGPMRQYCIGAILLDLDDPCRVIGQTTEPILVPTGRERFGYVPNVVYSCGGMIHAGNLILPYAMSDVATSIAVIDLQELLFSLAPVGQKD